MGWGLKTADLTGTRSPASTLGFPGFAVLGLAVVIFFAGLNVFFVHLNFSLVFAVLIALGLYFCHSLNVLGYLASSFPLPPKQTAAQWAFRLNYVIWFAVTLKSLAYPVFAMSDDYIAYLNQIRMVLDSASLIDPFSLRRLYSYGGQVLSQALFVFPTRVELAHVFESCFVNFCFISFLPILWSREKKGGRTNAAFFPMCLGIVFQLTGQLRENLSAQSSIYLLALLLLSLLAKTLTSDQGDREARATWLLFGMLAFFVSTLKSYAFFMVALLYFSAVCASLLRPGRKELTYALWSGLLTLALLLPSMAGMYLSSGTIFYPLWMGNGVDIGLFRGLDNTGDQLLFLLACFLDSSFLVFILVYLLLVPLNPRSRGAFHVTAASMAFCSVAIFWKVGFEVYACSRYTAPFLFSGTVALLCFSGKNFGGERDNFRFRAAVMIFLVFQCALIWQRVLWNQDAYSGGARGTPLVRLLEENKSDSMILESLQARVPAGEPFAVFVDKPYLLNHRRNPVVNLDEPGNASPGGKAILGDRTRLEEALLFASVSNFIFAELSKESFVFRKSRWKEKYWEQLPVSSWNFVGQMEKKSQAAVLPTTRFAQVETMYGILDELTDSGAAELVGPYYFYRLKNK